MRYGIQVCCGLLLILLTPVPFRPAAVQTEKHGEALRLLRKASDALARRDAARAGDLLSRGAREVADLAGEVEDQELLSVLRTTASVLEDLAREARKGRYRLSVEPYTALLDGLQSRFQQDPAVSGLPFQGAYVGARTMDQPAGGHASAPGTAAPAAESADELARRLEEDAWEVYFEEVPVISEKTFCGGPNKDHILESVGTGVALLDFDGDGLLDIFVVNAYRLTPERVPVPKRNLLYRNLGDWRFEDVSERAGVDLAAWGSGVCVGDYDNDGWLDLYVTNFGPNFLFRNNGDGTFSEVAAQSNVDYPGWSTGCAFLDSNGNGLLDLYVANYVETSWQDLFAARRTLEWRGGPRVMVGPVGLTGASDVFFANRGDGTFRDATTERGFAVPERHYGLGVLAGDLDGDGLIDVYVANDSDPNFLFQNRGGGRFQETGLALGAALDHDGRAQAGMGVDAGDFFGRGLMDIVVTNFAHDTNTLYRNLGNGLFEDATRLSGLNAWSFTPLGWGIAFLDVDLDGGLDLFLANGHIYPQVDEHPELRESFFQENQLLRRRDERLVDASSSAGPGLATRRSSRGLAVGDLDNDGRLDLVITNMDDAPTVLRNLTATPHNWIALELQKEGRNRFCIGARVTLRAGGQEQIREVRSGGSYLSQNDLRVFFGLGSNADPVEVEIRVPGEGSWRFTGVPVNQFVPLRLVKEERCRTDPCSLPEAG